MPAFKLTTSLYENRKLTTEFEIWLKNQKDGISDQILKAENAKQQIGCLKNVQKWIDSTLKTHPPEPGNVTDTLKFLVHLFFISTTKNPTRRVLISYFQNLPNAVKYGTIERQINTELLTLCEDLPRREDGLSVVDTNTWIQKNLELRHNIDTMSALIENFVLGEECVAKVSIEIVSYLAILQDNFYRTFRPELSPLQKNETMHHCMETVKLANRICQRSVVTMETRLQDREIMGWFKETTSRWLQADIGIIKHDEFLLDCKTTSAMNLCLMLNLTGGEDQLINILCQTVLKHCETVIVFDQSGIVPQWCADIGLDRLSKARLTSSAYLCLCYGILSMVDIKCLLQVHKGKCFILDILLPELLDLSKRVTDVGSKLLTAKSLFLLTQRIRTYLVKEDSESLNAMVYERLNGGQHDMKTILEYIWTSWEDSVEAVRFTVKDIFQNIVSIHLLVSALSALNDPFLGQLAISVLKDVSWSCKGKYGTLTVLVHHVGSTKMLELNPGIASQVLEQLEEQTLSCYVRDLYDELCTSHLKELKATIHTLTDEDRNQTIDWPLWFNCWVEPVINMLCQSTKMQKKHLIEYVLPKLLKTSDKTLYYMITTLSEQLHIMSREKNTRNRGDQLGALIMCLRRARALGLLHKASAKTNSGRKTVQISENAEKQLLFGVVETELLEYALAVKDEQIRLDAFALLCENQKTTEIISDQEICLVQTFIPQNMTNQNPAFRQLLLSYLKRLLSRMKESIQVLIRQMSKVSTAKDHITSYLTFLQWLSTFMLNCLYPGSTFPRRTTALNSLSLLIDTFNGKTESFSIFKLVQQNDVQSLLHCLTDTYEDNKVEAARLLTICFSQNISSLLLTHEKTKEYFDLAMTLSVSCRPQDGLTGAYLLQVLIHHPGIYDVLKNKVSALYSSDSHTKSENSRPVTLASSFDKTELSPFQVLLDLGRDSEIEKMALLLWILLKSLEDQTEVANSNLLAAAADKPLYPTMLCIRYLLCKIQFRKIEKKYYQIWNDFLSRLISLCLKISEIVSPVVHNCSPEGNIPVEAISGSLNNRPDVSESERTVMLMPEYLTVCCWRTVKEISLILGQLTSDLPLLDVGSDPNNGLLSYNQILSIGDYFTTQLLESKHRGAFELAYTGFIKVTAMLWRSNIPEFHSLPKTWLQEVMTNIVSDDEASRLCATRRSAGIPFYVQAIVSTEPSSTGRVCFKTTMVSLIELAYSEPPPDNCNPKVHALNILRMLYKDSKLKDDVTPYLADGLKVAILGFKSHLWAIRNAATLLMAAMMNRVFGVKRSKDESSLSRKNCQTGKTFFFKYPTLYQFLLDELSEATENIGTQLHPGLYPILMVLGRLFPSTMEGTDTALNLGAFIPFVVKCCSSPVLKTRMMAARALQPLVEKDHVISVFTDLLTLLPCSQEDGIRQNQVHGVLLQFQYMLQTVSMLPRSIVERLGDFLCSTWSKKMDFLISRSNPCMLTRTCAMEVTAEILASFKHSSVILEKLSTALLDEISDMSDSVIYSPSLPSLSQFMCTVSELYIQCMCTYFTQEVKTGSLTESDSHPSKVHGSIPRSELPSTSVQSKQVNINGTMKEDFSSRCKGAVEDEKQSSDYLYSFEDVCCKFLSSSSYEVRRSFLQKVTDICLKGSMRRCDSVQDRCLDIFEPEMESSPPEKIGSLDQPALEEFLLQLAKIDKIYELLLHKCLTEEHKECQLALFRLLKIYPCLNEKIANNFRMYLLAEEVIGFWLHRLEYMELCEEVVSSCIEYLGTSISAVCDQAVNEDDNKTAGNTSLAQLEKFTFLLRRLCETTETAVSIQLASARAIVKISQCTVLLSQLHGTVNRQGRDNDIDAKIGNVDGHVRGVKVWDGQRGGAKSCRPMDEVKEETEHGDVGEGEECYGPKVHIDMYQSVAKVKFRSEHKDVGGVKGLVGLRGGAKTLDGPVDGDLGYVKGCFKGGSKDGIKTTDGVNLADVSQSGTLSSGCIENFYRAILDLLQVDDLEVKDTITDLMTVISDEWNRGSPQSYICTSLVIENWIRTSPDVSLVASQLLHLILENREPEQREDERLFDRGEMNTFRDEINILQVVDTFLMRLLLKDVTGENAFCNMEYCNKVNKMTVSKATKFSCDRELCDKVLPVIISFIQLVIPQCSSQDGFLDSSKHEDYILQVYRSMLCFKYGFNVTQERDVLISVIDKWKSFQSTLNLNFLPSCIMKCYTDVCDFETVARQVHLNSLPNDTMKAGPN